MIPTKLTAMVGDQVHFTCIFKGKVKWKVNGSEITKPVLAKKERHVYNVLLINGVELVDAGIYSCHGENFVAEGHLIVSGETRSYL